MRASKKLRFLGAVLVVSLSFGCATGRGITNSHAGLSQRVRSTTSTAITREVKNFAKCMAKAAFAHEVRHALEVDRNCDLNDCISEAAIEYVVELGSKAIISLLDAML